MIKTIRLNENERLDDLHQKGYQIIQDPKRFCFGIDAVLLSGFAEVKKGERALDLCTGTGIVPILLSAKTEGDFFSGVEIQADSVSMARRSVLLNQLEDKIEITEGDIKDMTGLYKPSSFDVVTANPPYMNHGGGLPNHFGPKAIARHEIMCTLEDVIAAAARYVKPGGRFYMIHRPQRLVDILCAMRRWKLEPKTLRLIQPSLNKEPNMVLLEGVRNGKAMLKTLLPLVIYREDGCYTEETLRIYGLQKTGSMP